MINPMSKNIRLIDWQTMLTFISRSLI